MEEERKDHSNYRAGLPKNESSVVATTPGWAVVLVVNGARVVVVVVVVRTVVVVVVVVVRAVVRAVVVVVATAGTSMKELLRHEIKRNKADNSFKKYRTIPLRRYIRVV